MPRKPNGLPKWLIAMLVLATLPLIWLVFSIFGSIIWGLIDGFS